MGFEFTKSELVEFYWFLESHNLKQIFSIIALTLS